MSRSKVLTLAVVVALAVGMGWLAQYDRCQQCGHWYGPGLAHLFRHLPVPTIWG